MLIYSLYINTALSQSAFRIYRCYILMIIRSETNISLKIRINYNLQFAFYLKVLIQFDTVKYIFIYYTINTINKIKLYQSYKLIYPVPFMALYLS